MAPLPSYGLSASFTITNTGSVAGAEVARVYLHDTQSRVERPEVELKGFAKVFLEPGEAKRTTITMDVRFCFHAANIPRLTHLLISALCAIVL